MDVSGQPSLLYKSSSHQRYFYHARPSLNCFCLRLRQSCPLMTSTGHNSPAPVIPISYIPNSFRWANIVFIKLKLQKPASPYSLDTSDDAGWHTTVMVDEKWNSWLRRWSQVIPSHFEDPGHQSVTHSKSFSSNTCNTKQNHTVHTRNTPKLFPRQN